MTLSRCCPSLMVTHKFWSQAYQQCWSRLRRAQLPPAAYRVQTEVSPPRNFPNLLLTYLAFVIQLNATGMCGFSAVISIWSKWRSIRAICFGSHEEEGSLWMSELEKSTLPLHWTVLPVVAMQAFCGFWTDKLKNVHGRVSDAEHSTGMRRWLDPNVPVPEQVDLTQITRVLNSDIASAANHVSQSTTSIIVLGRLRQQLSNDTKDIQSSALRAIDMHIDYLVTAYEGERERAVYLKERASAQMQTVSDQFHALSQATHIYGRFSAWLPRGTARPTSKSQKRQRSSQN